MKGSVFIATTIDGKIADSNGGVDFLSRYQEAPTVEEEGDMGFGTFLESTDVIVMGRKSFDKVVSFGQDMWAYGEIPVVVWTRSENLDIPEYLEDRVTFSSLEPQDLFEELKAKGKTHAYIDGGTTIQSFLKAGLIHRLILTRVPFILGPGISLFDERNGPTELLHVKTQAYRNGLVQSTYEVKSDLCLRS